MNIEIYHATERGQRFEPFVPGNKLEKVWEGSPEDLGATLEDVGDGFLNDIFRIFNIEHPFDYQARSLSVGDVIKLGGFYFAVERFGFKHIPVWEVFNVNGVSS